MTSRAQNPLREDTLFSASARMVTRDTETSDYAIDYPLDCMCIIDITRIHNMFQFYAHIEDRPRPLRMMILASWRYHHDESTDAHILTQGERLHEIYFENSDDGDCFTDVLEQVMNSINRPPTVASSTANSNNTDHTIAGQSFYIPIVSELFTNFSQPTANSSNVPSSLSPTMSRVHAMCPHITEPILANPDIGIQSSSELEQPSVSMPFVAVRPSPRRRPGDTMRALLSSSYMPPVQHPCVRSRQPAVLVDPRTGQQVNEIGRRPRRPAIMRDPRNTQGRSDPLQLMMNELIEHNIDLRFEEHDNNDDSVNENHHINNNGNLRNGNDNRNNGDSLYDNRNRNDDNTEDDPCEKLSLDMFVESRDMLRELFACCICWDIDRRSSVRHSVDYCQAPICGRCLVTWMKNEPNRHKCPAACHQIFGSHKLQPLGRRERESLNLLKIICPRCNKHIRWDDMRHHTCCLVDDSNSAR